jgi:hypothetical protein
MRIVWKWVRRVGIAVYAVIAGLVGGGGPVIVDRRDMYGEDPATDPYSPDFDPSHRPRRER